LLSGGAVIAHADRCEYADRISEDLDANAIVDPLAGRLERAMPSSPIWRSACQGEGVDGHCLWLV
jgi:hypothetical protein